MTKIQQMLTSFVAVIPAAFLIYLLVMVMLSHSENLSTMAYVVMGGTLLATLITVLIPAGIFVGGNRQQSAEKASSKKAVKKGSEAVDDSVEVSEVEADSLDGDESLVEASDFEIDESDQEMIVEDEADIDTEPVEDFGEFDLEAEEEEVAFEEEEEPKPKKKKK